VIRPAITAAANDNRSPAPVMTRRLMRALLVLRTARVDLEGKLPHLPPAKAAAATEVSAQITRVLTIVETLLREKRA
jgi:hypothetical protein